MTSITCTGNVKLRWVMFGLWAMLVISAAGCVKSAESIAQQQIAAMDEVTAVLGEIRDEGTADSAMPKLERAVARLASANRAARATPSASPQDVQQIMKEVAPKLMDAGIKMAGAVMKAQVAAPRHAQQIADAINKADVINRN